MCFVLAQPSWSTRPNSPANSIVYASKVQFSSHKTLLSGFAAWLANENPTEPRCASASWSTTPSFPLSSINLVVSTISSLGQRHVCRSTVKLNGASTGWRSDTATISSRPTLSIPGPNLLDFNRTDLIEREQPITSCLNLLQPAIAY